MEEAVFQKIKAMVDAMRISEPAFLELGRICDEFDLFLANVQKENDLNVKLDNYHAHLLTVQDKLDQTIAGSTTVLADVTSRLEKVETSLNVLDLEVRKTDMNYQSMISHIHKTLDAIDDYLRRHT